MPDMLDTHMLDMDMVILDTMASVMLMLSPRLMLIPTFCMEDMVDTHMVDMPTTDKMDPDMKWTEQPSLFSLSVTTIFQCLIPFWLQIAGNNERKYKKNNMNKDTFCIEKK